MWVVPSSLIASILLAILVNKTYESILTVCLFVVNAIYINKDEIQLYLNKSPTSEMSSNRKYARLDRWNPNMSFDDAERLNAYWNYRDNRTPELQEIGGYKRKSRLGCDFEENRHGWKIAILGNSYATTHHKMIIQECRHRASTISMADVVGCEPLASPRKPVDNGMHSIDWSKQCAGRLEQFVEFINETQPDYAFMITRWFAVAEPYDNGPDNLNNDTIYLEMKSQLKKMLPNIKKKLFILDSFPRVRWQGIENIAKEMKEGKKTMEEITKSLYEPKQFEFGRDRHAELVKNECGSKCELIDYMDAFWNKTMNAFQYFDSKGFSYFTTTIHMSAHGIELVRPIYTKICAGL
ncbi:unnamed protein product [Caenorhabditis nigoni]